MTRFCRSEVPSGSGTSCNSRCGKLHANMGQVCKARLDPFSDLSAQVCDLCLEHWGWELPSCVHHHLHHNSSTQFMQSHITSSTPWFFKDKLRSSMASSSTPWFLQDSCNQVSMHHLYTMISSRQLQSSIHTLKPQIIIWNLDCLLWFASVWLFQIWQGFEGKRITAEKL